MSTPERSPAAVAAAGPSLWDAFERAARLRPGATCVRAVVGGDEVRETFSGVRRLARGWGRGLLALGLEPGAMVAIFADTRLEWLLADLAIAAAGGVSLPLDAALPAADLAAILRRCPCRFAFVAGAFEAERLLTAHGVATSAKLTLIAFERESRRERPDHSGRRRLALAELSLPPSAALLDADALAAAGDRATEAQLDARAALRSGDDLVTVVHTAGTTGHPRGVGWSHAALAFEAEALGRALALDSKDRVILGLPLAFAFARVVAWTSLRAGAELAVPEGRTLRISALQALQPTIVPAVPRQLDAWARELRLRVHGNGGVRQRLLGWAVSVGTETLQLRHQGTAPAGLLAVRAKVAHDLVLRRFPAAFGGRVRAICSGGAPLPTELAEWYHAVGLELVEGYGLTECCACATLVRPGFAKLGTVGKPLDGVEVAVAEDGEVLVRGPILMRGYHDAPDDTAAAIDEEGWLHTGDIGELGVDGWLRITDRKKDMIVTAGGKSVAPARIEAHLCASGVIETALVYGDGRPWLSALLTLDERALKRFCAEHDIPYRDRDEAIQLPEVYRMVERLVEERNRSLASYETIRKFAIIDRDLSVEDGDLTSGLEPRRAALEHRFSKLLASFYEDVY